MRAESKEIRIVRLEERAKSDRRVERVRRKVARRALKMQAREYERRLEALNHEHAKQVEERILTVSAEKFDGYEKQMTVWRDSVNKALNELQGHAGGSSSARQLTFQILPLLVSSGALLAVLLK